MDFDLWAILGLLLAISVYDILVRRGWAKQAPEG